MVTMASTKPAMNAPMIQGGMLVDFTTSLPAASVPVTILTAFQPNQLATTSTMSRTEVALTTPPRRMTPASVPTEPGGGPAGPAGAHGETVSGAGGTPTGAAQPASSTAVP